MSRLVVIFFLVCCCASAYSVSPYYKHIYGDIIATADCSSNATCANNNMCPSLACSRCNSTTGADNGTCVAGFTCGEKCNVNSDCYLFTGCDICSDGVCTKNPKGCGITCKNNNDCADPYCTACITGFCTVGYGCGHSCNVSSDCSAADNDCTACIQGVCSANCGRPCSQSSECEAGCGNCLNGFCSAQPATTTTTTSGSTTGTTSSSEAEVGKIVIN